MSNLHEKLKKLLLLSQKGIGGEKVNAQARLEALMKNHGITIEDLEGDEKQLQWFKVAKFDFGRKLFLQTMRAICGDRDTWKNKYSPGEIGIEVTAAEKIEIELRYDAYSVALKNELNIAYRAFVHVNDIFHKDAPSADPKDVDMEEIKRLAAAMIGMKPVPIHPAIADKRK